MPFEIRPGIKRFFRLAIRRADRTGAELDDEIRLHLALRTEQLIRDGLSPDAARAEAQRRFGPTEEARRALHASAERREGHMHVREVLGAWRQDLRLAVRGLLRSPVFTATAVTCLALGIGANAATFSLFDELLLRPLPVTAPEELINLSSAGPRPGNDSWNQAGATEALFSYPMYRDLARAHGSVTGIAAHRLFVANFSHEGRTEFGFGELVSGSYFPLLGLTPAVGRLLGPGDDAAVGGHPVAVLSYLYWTSVLGADPSIIGQSVVVNGRSLVVVGVAPSDFHGTTLGTEPRIFAPVAMAAGLDPGFGQPSQFEDRKSYWLYLFGRLRPGVTIEEAGAELDAIHHRMLAEVEAPLHRMSASTLERFKARRLTVEDGRRGQSLLHRSTRTPLVLLFSITGLVVLIASANVANLLLARAATRTTEMALRVALGAGRRRLLAQVLTESLLLAALGGVASVAVARVTLASIAALIPRVEQGAGGRLAMDLRPSAILFAALVSIGTGLVFGLFPARQSTRPDLAATLKTGSGKQSASRGAARFRASLVTAQIALSMTLLIGAGLFIASLRNVSRVDLGVDADHVVMFGVAPVLNGSEPARSMTFFARLEEELAATPGVTDVTAADLPLFSGSTHGGTVRVEGFERGLDTDANTRIAEVGPDFFHAMRIPLLAGRDIGSGDRTGAPNVAVVNEAFAKKFGLGPNPGGKRMAFDGESPDGRLDIEIVGLAHDTRYSGVKDGEPPIVFRPYRQDAATGGLFIYLRSALPSASIFRTVRETVARLDANLPVIGLKTMTQQVQENVYLDRMIGTLSAAFAGLATLLAAVGLYGVLAFTVAQRTREIGVRMALGAGSWEVRAMVLRDVGRMALIGAGIGVAAALALGRLAQSTLFGLESNDPRVILSAVVVLALVALGAGYVPARRASRVPPIRALRSD